MTQLILTKKSILADIEGYQQRIDDSKLGLSTLPTGGTWKERKKVKSQETTLANEIGHVQRLITYASEALNEFEAA